MASAPGTAGWSGLFWLWLPTMKLLGAWWTNAQYCPSLEMTCCTVFDSPPLQPDEIRAQSAAITITSRTLPGIIMSNFPRKPPRFAHQPASGGGGRLFVRKSRGAATDFSPRREPWENRPAQIRQASSEDRRCCGLRFLFRGNSAGTEKNPRYPASAAAFPPRRKGGFIPPSGSNVAR